MLIPDLNDDEVVHDQGFTVFRTQISFNLSGVVSQLLVPRINGGRAPSLEILVPNSGIRNMIREDKIHQIYSAMQTGQEKSGMQTMNQALASLVFLGKVSADVALSKSMDAEELSQMLAKQSRSGGG